MEKKAPIKISLPIFIVVLVLLVAIVYGIFMYKQNEKLEKEIADLRDGMSQTREAVNQANTEKSELQNRLNSISNIASKKETNTVTTNSTSESKTSKINNIEKSNNDTSAKKNILSRAKPSGFAGSSLKEVILYSDGEVYLLSYDGDGEDESNISTKNLIAKKATSVETCKDENDENYGSVIVKAEEVLLQENYGWIVFK